MIRTYKVVLDLVDRRHLEIHLRRARLIRARHLHRARVRHGANNTAACAAIRGVVVVPGSTPPPKKKKKKKKKKKIQACQKNSHQQPQ
jgi:hypothetical protein